MDDMKQFTREEAREHFSRKGLTYKDVSEGDICTLVMLLNKSIKEACKRHEMSVDSMRMSQKVKCQYTSTGRLIKGDLYINSHYFTQRECISFNPNGFIGFCGWADERNTAPILKAFMEWCNTIAS